MHSRPSTMFILTTLMFLPDFVAMAGTAKNCRVTFATKGQPVLVKIEGKSDEPCTGSFTTTSGELGSATFKMKLTAIDTGIALRNKHLRENYLHTDKHPEAEIRITKLTDLKGKLDGSSNAKSVFEGTLNLHGVEKPIREGQYSIEGKGVTAEFCIDLPDHDVEKPAFMGVKIVDKVYVTVKFEMGE